MIILVLVLILYSCERDKVYSPEVSVHKIKLPEPIDIFSIIFLNNDKGFAAGGVSNSFGSIYRTDNGGRLWYRVFSSDSLAINDLFFINDSVGYACGDSIMLLKTNDGGQSWDIKEFSNLPHDDDIVSYNEIYAKDTGNIFIVGGNGANKGLLSIMENSTWSHTYFLTDLFTFASITEFVMALGANDFIVFSEDGGNTFDDVEFSGHSFRTIRLNSKNEIFALSASGVLYYSNDLGYNWSFALRKPNHAFTDMHFEEGYSAICGRKGSLFLSYDSPYYWVQANNLPSEDFFTVYIKPNGEIFLGSDNGNIYLINKRRPHQIESE